MNEIITIKKEKELIFILNNSLKVFLEEALEGQGSWLGKGESWEDKFNALKVRIIYLYDNMPDILEKCYILAEETIKTIKKELELFKINDINS